MKKNKTMILIIIILIVLIVVFSIFTKNNNSNKNTIINSYVSKLNFKDINMSIDSCDLDKLLTYNDVPYFKLNKPVYKTINEEILTDFLLRTCYQNGALSYETNISNDILSLVLIVDLEDNDIEYKTYNIDLNTNALISNEDLLKKYNITIDNAENILMNTFNDYYIYEKNNGDNNLTFNNFLKQIGYQKLDYNNINLYVEKNNLYLYNTYSLTELMEFDENYPQVIVKFKLS